jgi:Zn-dependent protease with chaperone function
MYAFVLIGLIFAIVSVDLASGERAPDPWVVLPATALLSAAVFLAGILISLIILRRTAALEGDEQGFLRRVGVLGRAYRSLALLAYAAIVFWFGWPAMALDAAGDEWIVPPLALTLVPLLVLMLLSWIAVYWADRGLRAAMFARAGAVAPVAQWTLPRFLEFMFRQYVLVMLVPLVALIGVQDVINHVAGSPEGPLAMFLLVASLGGAFLLAGPWVRLCWKTAPMPEGDLRDRLFALADRAGIRVANVLVWRTNLSIANGCMVGMVGPLRYILITDALLLAMSQTPEEVEAVFAHEVAHVKYRHTWLFAALAIGGVAAALIVFYLLAAAVPAVLDAARAFLGPHANLEVPDLLNSQWAEIGTVAIVVMAYWWLGFGYVSRRCEVEADLYAARATNCPVACSPPDAGLAAAGAATGSPEPLSADAVGQGVCEHRVAVFINALRRIARLNGAAETTRGWRHFSIERRCRILAVVAADPAQVPVVERRIRRVKAGALLVAFILAAAAAGVWMASQPSQTDDPEAPAGPEDINPERPTWLVRLVDRDEVDELALGSPEFHRHAHAAADLDDGGLAGLRLNAPAADDDVAVQDARGHAVAVHAQGERARTDRQAR